MRILSLAPALALSSLLAVAASGPASAQLSGGVGSSNAANQSFQQQNAFRGLEQQQTFNNNAVQSQNRSNQLYNPTTLGSQGYVPRRRHR